MVGVLKVVYECPECGFLSGETSIVAPFICPNCMSTAFYISPYWRLWTGHLVANRLFKDRSRGERKQLSEEIARNPKFIELLAELKMVDLEKIEEERRRSIQENKISSFIQRWKKMEQ